MGFMATPSDGPQRPWWRRNLHLALLTACGYGVLVLIVWRVQVPAREWNSLMNATTAYLLLLNLLVLWWYAHLTAQTADAAGRQARATKHQLRLLEEDREESSKPIVFTDRKRIAGSPGSGKAGEGAHYFARNVGHGLAVNVFYVQISGDEWSALREIGSLERRGEVRYPDDLEQPLRDHSNVIGHVLGAESLGGEWTITINVRDAHGDITHRHHGQIREFSFEDVLRRHNEELRQAVLGLEAEVRNR
jgi:hypothetical protein